MSCSYDFTLKDKESVMTNKIWFVTPLIMVVLLLVLGLTGLAFADYEDFVDPKEVDKQVKYCGDQFNRCNRKCGNEKKQIKCLKKCNARIEKCLDSATFNAVKEASLPDDAKKLWEKIAKKQDKAFDKCQTMYTSVWEKCEKKHGVDDAEGIRDCIDKSGVQVKQDACIEKVQQKYPFKSKKMVQLLKGKTP